jgi:hypothetical protein
VVRPATTPQIRTAEDQRVRKLRAQTLTGGSRPSDSGETDADRTLKEMRESLRGWQYGR